MPTINFNSPDINAFTTDQQRDERLRRLGAEPIGHSESGRDILALAIGAGPKRASLIAGNHSDEPVGPETLLHLAEAIADDPPVGWRFIIVPHVNPDGEAANRDWIDRWPDPLAYLQHAFREKPGRDIEFGYPTSAHGDALRMENRVVADYLAESGPYDLHLSLHGMAVATGGMLLIERGWIDRTKHLREQYAAAMTEAGLELFDWDRDGEKGFEYIGPGFQTTPRGEAMRQHFIQQNDEQTAAGFLNSSMEYAQTLGGDPLCLVTELPLFVLDHQTIEDQPGDPKRYHEFKQRLPEVRTAIRKQEFDVVAETMREFSIRPFPLSKAMALQVRAIELGMQTAEAGS
jgi:hypothetical protein